MRMGLTGGTRAVAAIGTGTLLAGAAATLHAVARSNPAQALGGLCLTMAALTLIALYFIHRWFTNTSAERCALGDATRAADDERNRYVCMRAALENEHGRLSQALAEERAAAADILAAEKEALRSEFEERRASLIIEAMEATVRMHRNGKFAPETPAKGTLIQFPRQEPAHGHNAVGP